jgi:hypothetical protein
MSSTRVETPSASSFASTRFSASGSPDTTVWPGPLSAAIPTSPSPASSAASATSTLAVTAAVAPSPLRLVARRLRSTMTFAASSSESAPATVQALTSPMLCPITACGSMPHERHSCASDTWSAHSAGWLYSGTSMRERLRSAVISSSSDQSTWFDSASSQRASARTKTGSSSSSRLPMSARS